MLKWAWDLGAKDSSAEMCKLSANDYGAEPWV
jgi:hypothetical protein